MVLIVKIVSVAIIIYGCMVVLKPGIMKKIVEEVKKDKMIYKINGVKTVISLLLVLAASSCSVPWIVFLIGALGLLGGACVFIFKKKVIDKFISWMETRSKKQICMIGTVAVIVGVLLALAA